MRSLNILRLLAALTAPMAVGGSVLAQTYDLSWYTLDGGGATSVGGSFSLAGTVGQSDASSFSQPMTGGTFEVVGGFWVVAAASPPPQPGDCDADGDLDLDDHACFAACMAGPEVVPPENCEASDIDADGHVDLLDFAEFQSAFAGG